VNLKALIDQGPPPFAWETTAQIPWSDPDFSQHALQAHLSQKHDVFSRRDHSIKAQIHWMHHQLLAERPVRILDLACGPGLYTQQLARLGHQCVGIDIAPAAIDYARKQRLKNHLDCKYQCGDILELDYGREFDLVLLNFAALNYFPKPQAALIIQKIAQALNRPGGILLIEVLSVQGARSIGNQEPVWQRNAQGLFCDQPHLYLEECFWNKQHLVATERYTIITVPQVEIRQYLQSYQAYVNDEYEFLLKSNGFQQIDFYEGLTEENDDFASQLLMLIAK